MPDRDMLMLVPVFDAILTEQSLSRAAGRLGVTQSAVSQALKRLRALAGDPLFERTSRGVRPTPRALEMASHLQAALTHVSTAFSPVTLDTNTLDRTFVVDIGAGFDVLVLPMLIQELTKRAPNVRVVVSNAQGRDLLAELKFGETELAFDFQSSDAPDIRSELLGRSNAVVLARSGHPALKKGMSKEHYLALPHVTLVWARSASTSGIATEHRRLGLKPRVAASVPTLMTLGAVVASTDLIATTSAAVASYLTRYFAVRSHAPPYRFAPLGLYQLWHARFDEDAAHVWLRATIKRLFDRVSRGRTEFG